MTRMTHLQASLICGLAMLPCIHPSVCDAADPAPTTAPSTRPAAFDVIRVETLGGISGRGNGEAMLVRADGTITCWSLHHVEHNGRLTADELAELQKRVSSVNWAAVAAGYASEPISDGLENYLTVVVAGETRKVHVQYQIDTAVLPADFRDLCMDLGRLYQRCVK